MERKQPISKLITQLYAKSEYYSQILSKYTNSELVAKYKNKELNDMFEILPTKFISICPMSLCDSLLLDLGINVTEKQLAALGFVMFGISMHDDIVDEMYEDRKTISDLLFAGNIACNEGIKILLDKETTTELATLLSVVNQNHFYQQYNIYTLWTKKPNDFSEYLDGLQHDIAFMQIGIEYGLSIAGRPELIKDLNEFIKNYAYGIQLLDDLREAEEDKEKGYFSYPVIEGSPYKKTIEKIIEFTNKLKISLNDDFKNLRKIAIAFENVVTNYLNTIK